MQQINAKIFKIESIIKKINIESFSLNTFFSLPNYFSFASTSSSFHKLSKYLLNLGLFLQFNHQMHVLDTQHGLGDGNEEQVGNLIAVVLLFYRVVQQPLFHIVGDHGAGEGEVPQPGNILGNVLGGLLQVQPHVGDFLVPGQGEMTDGGKNLVLGFLIHSDCLLLNIFRYHTIKM